MKQKQPRWGSKSERERIGRGGRRSAEHPDEAAEHWQKDERGYARPKRHERAAMLG